MMILTLQLSGNAISAVSLQVSYMPLSYRVSHTGAHSNYCPHAGFCCCLRVQAENLVSGAIPLTWGTPIPKPIKQNRA